MANRTTRANAVGMSDTATAGASQLKTKTESQKLVASNPGRVALVVSNIGEKDVYLGLGTTAVSEKGIYLKEKGGSIVIDFFTGEVTAIAKESEPILSYVEV